MGGGRITPPPAVASRLPKSTPPPPPERSSAPERRMTRPRDPRLPHARCPARPCSSPPPPALGSSPGQPIRATRAPGGLSSTAGSTSRAGPPPSPPTGSSSSSRRRGSRPASGPRCGCSTTTGRLRRRPLLRRQPAALAHPLGRRDSPPFSDSVAVIIDSNRDRRTAYYFELTAAGVQSDALLFGDDEFERRLGRGLGRRRTTDAGLERRVPDPALGAPLLRRRRPDLGIRAEAGGGPLPRGVGQHPAQEERPRVVARLPP